MNYIRQHAIGSEFEGTIEQNNAVLAFGKELDKDDSPYVRVRHGIYQKIPLCTLQDQQLSKQLIELHRFLDQAVSLQEQMATAYAEGSNFWPDYQERFGACWKSADTAIDEAIDCLAAWIAETEDFDMNPQNHQQSVPEMQM